jgi:hypothetical protein
MFIIDSGHIVLQRPAQINVALWNILQRCWDRVALTRPTMDEVDIAIQHLVKVD